MSKPFRLMLVSGLLACAWSSTVLAQATTYTTSDAPVAIPDNTGTFVACQNIVVPPGAGTIGDLDVVTSITHTWVGDLTIQVQSPGGASTLMLMNRPGRTGTGFGRPADFDAATPITFNDSAASGRSAETVGENPVATACSGTAVVGTSACPPDNYIPAPDAADTPIAGLGTNLAQFNGTAAPGTWTLCVADSAAGDTGTLTSWSMLVTPAGPPTTPPVFGYTPTPGSTVTATGGTGVIGTTSNLSIAVSVATPGSGSGAPATTTLTCTAPTAPFAGFGQTVTAVGNGAISGGPLTGTCTRGATAVTQTLTCTENQGDTSVTRTWTLSCPAGTPPISTVPVNATSTWSLIALMLALLGFAAVAVRRQG